MKLFSIMFAFLTIDAAFAGQYAGPVLVYKLGGLAHQGDVRTCEIYPTHSSLKNVDWHLWIDKASQATISTALHVRAQVPSVEYYAYKVVPVGGGTSGVKAEKVLLVQDYSDLKRREGQEAQKLVELIEDICE